MIFTYVSALAGPKSTSRTTSQIVTGIAFLVVRIKIKGELFDCKNSDRPEIKKY